MPALLRTILRRFRAWKHPYRPLIEVRVYKDNILHNYRAFQSRFPNISIAPVLKSNAYGHGLCEVGQIMASQQPPFLCVDSLFEALTLQSQGIRIPILILGYTPAENISKKFNGISFGITDIEELRRISRNLHHATDFHMKLDTGMHRHGILPGDIEEALRLIGANSNITVSGVYSHFADADTLESEKTKNQINLWNALVHKIRAALPSIHYWHCANTAGSSYANQIDANVMRLGIGLYGISSGKNNLNLKPALEVATKIISLRNVAAGETVGYNNTFQAEQDATIASIPMGYFEGLDRRLSNQGLVYVHDSPCRIVGRVSMNIASIEISHPHNVHVGDEVVVIGKDQNQKNSIEHIAQLCGTIPYEILVHIPAHLRRVVV